MSAVELDVATSTSTDTFALPEVDSIDDIVLVVGDLSRPINGNSTTLLCFEARSNGLPIAGLTWKFEGDPVWFVSDVDKPLPRLPEGGCVGVMDWWRDDLTVTAGGMTKTFVIPFAQY